jgi:hypothetical protein
MCVNMYAFTHVHVQCNLAPRSEVVCMYVCMYIVYVCMNTCKYAFTHVHVQCNLAPRPEVVEFGAVTTIKRLV